MAIRLSIINPANGNTIAFRELTDAQVARLNALFPGTGVQLANAVLDDTIARLRAIARERARGDGRAAAEAQLQTDEQAALTAFESEWA